ncbi:MAG: 50S ribosomal protein L19 [Hymenobacter sp.]
MIRRGKVRRARLFYLRGLSGKAARIKEAPPRNREGSSCVDWTAFNRLIYRPFPRGEGRFVL